jgi:hypothetical protein
MRTKPLSNTESKHKEVSWPGCLVWKRTKQPWHRRWFYRLMRRMFGNNGAVACAHLFAQASSSPGHQMVGALPTCLWFGFRSRSVGRGAAPTAKTTRNARDSASVGPISSYIRIGLLSAAAQNEHRTNQYAEKESCFHLELSSLSDSGPDARFSTRHLSVSLSKSKL